jgi:Uma2 family endonuclease
LVIAEPVDPDASVADASVVRLICEIVSASNPAADRVLKMQLYAEAGIPWYLLVEQDGKSVLLRLFRLDGDHYTEHAAGAPGIPLEMDLPIAVSLDPGTLLPRRTR